VNIDQAILSLIESEDIVSQARLRARLAELDFVVTQPTLSRHLGRLSIQKQSGVYRRVERVEMNAPDHEISLVPPNLIVCRTRPGRAQLLAVLLDDGDIDGMAGTLAGDDVVFIAVNHPDLEAVAARVEALFTRD
jgi:transcriptional regulator of arginine metabolism